MTAHKARNTAAILAAADTSAAMPHVVEHPTKAMRERRLARLWRVAGAIAYLETDRSAFRDLLEACGLLAYEPAGRWKAEQSPVNPIKVPGQ